MEERPEEQPGKRVAIVGFTNSRELAPWGDPDWEIWICNNLWKFCPPEWDRLYDLHENEEIRKDREHDAFLHGAPQQHANGNAIQLGKRPAYVFKPQPDWPTATTFPKDEVTDKLGQYFTNSISWMIAHALMEGCEELHVYGVDMATGGEYAAQRPSCEYLLGIAVGMGVKVYVPPQSDLLKVTAMYGTGGDSALHAKMIERKQELTERKGQVEGQLNALQQQLAQIHGALETTNYILDVWTNPRASRGSDDGVPPSEAIAQIPEEVAA